MEMGPEAGSQQGEPRFSPLSLYQSEKAPADRTFFSFHADCLCETPRLHGPLSEERG